MMDTRDIKVHLHAAGAQGGSPAMGRTKGGLNMKIHMAVDAQGLPVTVICGQGRKAHAVVLPGLPEAFSGSHEIRHGSIAPPVAQTGLHHLPFTADLKGVSGMKLYCDLKVAQSSAWHTASAKRWNRKAGSCRGIFPDHMYMQMEGFVWMDFPGSPKETESWAT